MTMNPLSSRYYVPNCPQVSHDNKIRTKAHGVILFKRRDIYTKLVPYVNISDFGHMTQVQWDESNSFHQDCHISHK